VRSERLCQRKIPITPSEIEPATFRFVEQHLNHCATAVPFKSVLSILVLLYKFYKGKGRTKTGHDGQEGEYIYSSILSLTSTLDGGALSSPHRGRFTGTHCIGGWDPGPAWTGAENLAPTGILSPDRPAGSESLYRLRFPDPTTTFVR